MRWKDRKLKYDPDGVPVDARDWTEDDWRDLHCGISVIKAMIAARHKAAPESRQRDIEEGPRA
jgi:hypothetical protein